MRGNRTLDCRLFLVARDDSLCPASTCSLQGIEALAVSNCNLVVLGRLKDLVQVFQRLSHVVQGNVTATTLVERQGRLMDVVSVRESLSRIFVRPCRHQQVSCIDVDHWVFL